MLLISLFFTFAIGRGDDFTIVNRGELKVEKPAFISLTSSKLIISSFKLFGRDHIFTMPQNESELRSGFLTKILTDKIIWPNEVTYFDSSFFGVPGYLISSGFLLPTKSTGAISFLEESSGKIIQLTTHKKGYFYHRAVFIDVTGSGRLDILTARAKISPLGITDGELVWLKRPKDPMKDPWTEEVLAKGPDIHFRVFPDKKYSETLVVAAEFSNKQLKLLWIEKNGAVGARIIDATLGSPFDLDFYDLNNDGKKDLLVTNHQSDLKAAVFAYEIPQDIKNGNWVRHTLLEGIETRQKGFNQASPGVAKAFHPDLKNTRSKPWILVSGDGSQRVHLLVPQNEDSQNWNYSEKIILDTNSTVGEPVIYDIDGDGLTDFVIPAYDADKLYFLSIKRRQI
jgi:hypothetical protein